jgi:hypothetical protein
VALAAELGAIDRYVMRRTQAERAGEDAMKVLLAIDGSPSSHAAVTEVAGRHWPTGSEITVLTAAHTRTPLLRIRRSRWLPPGSR